jgi:formate hydrogenlyase transcriptional activator
LACSFATFRGNKSSFEVLDTGFGAELLTVGDMAINAIIAPQSDTDRYRAVVRISEVIAACGEPEELVDSLASELDQFLHFDHLHLTVLKENSKQIEYRLTAKRHMPLPDMPIEELPTWEVINSPDPLRVVHWDSEKLSPRFKRWTKEMGIGCGVSVLMATPHRRLGVLGVVRDKPSPFSDEDLGFLGLIARVVAFALDDGLNLRRSLHQNDQLKLLLNVSNQLTSNLELRELLRAVAGNIRKLMQCDAVAVSLLPTGGKFRLFVLDFPQGKGVLREEQILTLSTAGKRVLETLRPTVVRFETSAELPPQLAAEGFKCRCLIPLVNRGVALGVLMIGRTSEATFTPEDVEFLSQAAGQIAIAIENALTFEEVCKLRDKLAQEKLYLEEEIRGEMSFENIIGNSPAINHVLELVETVAPSDSTVLLLGETGTGKELIARAIHDRSRRKDRTFVKVNCAAIPTGLLESELFGHEKGAFTGAIAPKIGRMELADQGTLFLDEVGDIPIEVQPKLLRALQEREFERLGSTHTRRVNVRLIAATNRDLEKMITDREFRSDLYYRLHVFPIRVPPLRERKEDILQLVSYFVQKFAKQMQKKIEAISPAVMSGLAAWDWPGNIRELENFVERAVILTRGNLLEAPLGELPKTNTIERPRAEDRKLEQVVEGRTNSPRDTANVRDEYERRQRDEIVRALAACKGRVGGPGGAAARLGMNRTTFFSRLKKFGIYAKQYA